jgi:hypothetical protein
MNLQDLFSFTHNGTIRFIDYLLLKKQACLRDIYIESTVHDIGAIKRAAEFWKAKGVLEVYRDGPKLMYKLIETSPLTNLLCGLSTFIGGFQ